MRSHHSCRDALVVRVFLVACDHSVVSFCESVSIAGELVVLLEHSLVLDISMGIRWPLIWIFYLNLFMVAFPVRDGLA